MKQFDLKRDNEDLSGCLASQPLSNKGQEMDHIIPAKRKLDDEDLSGCLVHSGFFAPAKTNKLTKPTKKDPVISQNTYDEDLGSDWLYEY
jgi:hypothetical protein